MYTCNKDRMQDKIETFSQFGATGNGGITRYSLSPEAHLARDEFVKRMKAIGAIIETDDMANVYATLPGSEEGLKRIVMGSHVDSVRNGGNYDGVLGVLAAMEVLETIADQNIPHRHPITAMIWTNEEGSLYPPAMMVSGVVCNDYLPPDIAKKFIKEDMLRSKSVLDRQTTFGERLDASPYKGDTKNRLNPDDYKAMFELHIEQGPILEDAGNEIGVVTCVLGMFNYRIRFYGQSDHAGTTPMHKRQDALYAASKAICYLHEEIDKLNRPELVYTTGEVLVHPNVHTVIPDLVDFSLDVRHEDPELRQKVLDIVMSLLRWYINNGVFYPF
jgi:N-carbamoyl-L-amino-acid hydrolase